MASFTLTGDKELARQLAALSDAVRGETLLKALVSGALLVANDAKQRAPYLSGNLRRSIHVGGEGVEGDTTGTDIGGQTASQDFAEVLVGTNVEYAIYQELGTSKMAAQPFLRPAVESSRGEVETEISGAMRDLLRRVV